MILNEKAAWGLKALLCLAALYIAVITGWISDDSRITFRQVWNFINGDGMTFNAGERVQAFTHPLWFFLLSGAAVVTQELFATTLALSIGLSLAAVALLLAAERRANQGRVVLLTPVLLLIFSVAFCDYMTSGLENPLAFFLIGLLLWFIAAGDQARRRIFLILALLVLTRFDYAVLFLPLAVLLAATSHAMRDLLRDAWPGVTLLVAWFAFALIYFGSPLPNTFYAKMAAGYPLTDVLERALNYFEASLLRDPISLVIILAGLAVSVASGKRVLLALAAGQALYLGFIVKAGGDFMQGRFFAVPVFLSVGQMILAFAGEGSIRVWSRWIVSGLLLAAVALGGLTQYPFLSKTDYRNQELVTWVADERGFFYQDLGLLSRQRQSWPQLMDQSDEDPVRYTIACGGLGKKAASALADYLMDNCALANPFLARLPAIQSADWRMGHHRRKVPTDYGEYLLGNVEELPDASLNNLLHDVSLAARGQLFTQERLAAIWRLNSGHYSSVDMGKYSDPTIWVPLTSKKRFIPIEQLDGTPKPDRYGWAGAGTTVTYRSLDIEVGTPVLTTEISLSLQDNNAYEIYVNAKRVASINRNNEGRWSMKARWALKNHTIRLPEPMLVETMEVRATDTMDGAYKFALGHLHTSCHAGCR